MSWHTSGVCSAHINCPRFAVKQLTDGCAHEGNLLVWKKIKKKRWRTEEFPGRFFLHAVAVRVSPWWCWLGCVHLPEHWLGGSALVFPPAPLSQTACTVNLVLERWSCSHTTGTWWSSERQRSLLCQRECAMSLLSQWYFRLGTGLSQILFYSR